MELMAGIMHAAHGDRESRKPDCLSLLGQMLLYPPNVAGWPSGKVWIDSSTLLLRCRYHRYGLACGRWTLMRRMTTTDIGLVKGAG
jgi:uncharacterized protein (DUF1800 family)